MSYSSHNNDRSARLQNLHMKLGPPIDDGSATYRLFLTATPVDIFVSTGIKLHGEIDWLDEAEIVLWGPNRHQIVYRSQIISSSPNPGVQFFDRDTYRD